MANLLCGCRRNCAAAALIISIAIGVLAAFLQITGVFTVSVAALVTAFGIAVIYLAALLVVAARTQDAGECRCASVSLALVGALLTVLASLVLLAVGFPATSVLGAIIVGVLAAGFSLLLTATACLVRCLAGCDA